MGSRLIILFLFSTTVGAVVAASASAADPTVVTIPGLGQVKGVANGLAREFRALPYAAPPLRFAAPTPPSPWAGVRDATADGPGCMQACTEPAGVCPASVSEDCLLLNVFTPLTADASSNLPVLVFFHGGAFRDGFSGGPLYNGTYLSTGTRDPAIVVAASYRLGAFGFLYGSGALPQSDDPSGNFGILDQRAALVWVQAHVAAFGGDPSRVVIWGQSAGAMSIATHLVSPGSRGLFAAAALDSEPLSLPFRSVASARAIAGALVVAAGCEGAAPTPAACLRALSASALLAAQTLAVKNITADLPYSLLQAFVPFTPTTGTPDVPNAPLASFQGLPGTAPVADVPVVLTTVASEGTIFICASGLRGLQLLGHPLGCSTLPPPLLTPSRLPSDEGFGASMSELEYAALLEVAFGPVAGIRVGFQYPVPPGFAGDVRPLVANVTTAALFRCASRNATRALASAPGRTSPVFLGEWTRLLSWAPALWTNATPAYHACWTQVCHAQELPFLFYPQLAGRTAWTPEEAALSSAGRGYLAAFAASRGATMGDGAGNGASPLAWPPLNAADDATPRMVFDSGARRLEYADDACALWDELGYTFY